MSPRFAGPTEALQTALASGINTGPMSVGAWVFLELALTETLFGGAKVAFPLDGGNAFTTLASEWCGDATARSKGSYPPPA